MTTTVIVDWEKHELTLKDNLPKPETLSHGLRLVFLYAGVKITGKFMNIDVQVGSSGILSIDPTSVRGNREPVENVEFRSSDESVLTIDASGNIVAINEGFSTVSITADAQIGEGTVLLSESIEFHVLPELAVKLNPTFTPFEQNA